MLLFTQDANLTWYTEIPDVTPCFLNTVLLWVPCGWLWVMAALEIHYLFASVGKYIPWTKLNVSKLLLASGLLVLHAADLVRAIASHRSAPVFYFTPVILVLTMASRIRCCSSEATSKLYSHIHPQDNLYGGCHFVFLSRQMVSFVNGKAPLWQGCFFALGLLIASTLQALLYAPYFQKCMVIGVRAAAAIIAAIYKKSLRLSPAARRESTVGEMVNLISVDAKRYQDISVDLTLFFTLPIQLGISFYLLWVQLGPSLLAGIGVIAVAIPINSVIAARFQKLQVQQMKEQDEKVKLMSEVLNGIKGEVAYVPQEAWIRNATLKSNVLFGKTYDETVYKEILKACALEQDLAILPAGDMTEIGEKGINLSGGQKQRVSLARAVYSDEDVYLMDDPLSAVDSHTRVLVTHGITHLPQTDLIIMMKDGRIIEAGGYRQLIEKKGAFYDFIIQFLSQEEGEDSEDELEEIKHVVEIVTGKKIIVRRRSRHQSKVSESESGRSVPDRYVILNVFGSYLHILVIFYMLRPVVRFQKKKTEYYILMVKDASFKMKRQKKEGLSDQAFLNGTVNDSERYKYLGVYTALGLSHVVIIAGVFALAALMIWVLDVSSVDEGIALFLEDVLISAFEVVGALMINIYATPWFLVAIGPIIIVYYFVQNMYVSTSRQLKRLESVSRSLIYSHFGETVNGISSIRAYRREEQFIRESADAVDHNNQRQYPEVTAARESSTPAFFTKGINLSGGQKQRVSLARAVYSDADVYLMDDLLSAVDSDVGKHLFQRVIGPLGLLKNKVKWRVYAYFLKSMGLYSSLVSIFMYGISEGFLMGSNMALSRWPDEASQNRSMEASERDAHIGVYTALGVCYGITQPMEDGVSCAFEVICAVMVIAYAFPWFLVAVVPIFTVYYLAQDIYVSTARQLRRLEAIWRSPIYSHFTPTVAGISSIPAYKREEQFIRESEEGVDRNNKCQYPLITSLSWLRVRLEALGGIITLVASLLAVFGRDSLSPALAGLCITYAMSVSKPVNWLAHMMAEVETSIVGVERIEEYCETPVEALWEIPEKKPKDDWPQEGTISFREYQTRYRDGLELVLKGVSIDIKGGEKVGVVGRTGAGKTSLILGVFRVIEKAGGEVTIDGIDISQIGLHDLRSNLTIIPQCCSPEASVRTFEKHTDDEIWRTLELSHLKAFAKELPQRLRHPVAEGGQNLSYAEIGVAASECNFQRRHGLVMYNDKVYLYQTPSGEFKTLPYSHYRIREVSEGSCTSSGCTLQRRYMMVLLSVLAHVKLEVTSPHTIVLKLEGDNRLRKKTIEEKLGSPRSSVRWHADDADIEKCIKTEEVRAKYNVVW
ncbi:unnamed protein product [Darwinula stevensoni]|uniref:Uncharacterized protein n=1 Tax=Darwinula stevensoni TaxID=69355 RepID=A0A7R8X4F0_9CRUS|nr:unnamed protein product [Darwinula stevensoni]CAG0885967.1 unnamed protein product [Darwinula stevensoni]